MPKIEQLRQKLERVFNKAQAEVLAEVIVSAYDELVKVSDFNELKEIVKELAQEQKKLAQEQKKLAQGLEELAQAQKETQKTLKELTINVSRLGEVLGFGLEDIARVMVPGYLLRHEKIEIEGELSRNFFVVDGKEIEVNLYGEGKREGVEVVVIGEVKTRIYEREAKSFLSCVVEPIRSIIKDKELYPLMFAYFIHPSAQALANLHGIHLIASYQR
jgi:predicted nuclease with TOPRIM domain